MKRDSLLLLVLWSYPKLNWQKARSKKESADKKVEDLEHIQAQLTGKIERQESE